MDGIFLSGLTTRDYTDSKLQSSKEKSREKSDQITDDATSTSGDDVHESVNSSKSIPESKSNDNEGWFREAISLVSSYSENVGAPYYAASEMPEGSSRNPHDQKQLRITEIPPGKKGANAKENLKLISEEFDTASGEVEELESNFMRSEISALKVALQNAAALHSSIIDVEEAVTKSESIIRQLRSQKNEALSAQGNLNNSKVLQLIS
ncbi:MAG: hypothetical protein GF315_12535 [candidate division Zixibacteria bacterium]|nr:hypothetical protein [candidate division Zixibacteria bacterium]